MKYQTMVKMQRNHESLLWNLFIFYTEHDEPNEQYTIFDFLKYIPTNTLYYLGVGTSRGIGYLWNHRKKWVIAKQSNANQKSEGKE